MNDYVVPPYPLFSAPTKILDPLIRAKLQEHYDFLVNAVASDSALRHTLFVSKPNVPLDVKLGAEVEIFVNSPEYYEEGSDRTKANKTKRHNVTTEEFRSELANRLVDILLPPRARDKHKGWANIELGRHYERGGLSRDGAALLEARTTPMPLDDIIAAYKQIAAEVGGLVGEMDGVAAAVPYTLHIHQSARQGGQNAYFYNKSHPSVKVLGSMASRGVMDFWDRARPLAGLPRDLVLGSKIGGTYVKGEKVDSGIQIKGKTGHHRLETRFHTREWAAHPELSLLIVFAGIRRGIEFGGKEGFGYRLLQQMPGKFTLDIPYLEAVMNMKNDTIVRQYLGGDLVDGLSKIVSYYPAIESGEMGLDAARQMVAADPEIARLLDHKKPHEPQHSKKVLVGSGARER